MKRRGKFPSRVESERSAHKFKVFYSCSKTKIKGETSILNAKKKDLIFIAKSYMNKS